MAIALHGGHAQRALDFYNTSGKYFIIGGTTPWETKDGEGTEVPADLNYSDYKLRGIIGLKSVEDFSIVKPTSEESGEDIISYNGRRFKKVIAYIETSLSSAINQGATSIVVSSLGDLKVGMKLRVANTYQGTITSINGLTITLDTASPAAIKSGSKVISGALVEDEAKYVYMNCTLETDVFPVATYRQVGLCTGVIPNNQPILKAKGYGGAQEDEFTHAGTLEVLDNLPPSTRSGSQSESLSLIIEF